MRGLRYIAGPFFRLLFGPRHSAGDRVLAINDIRLTVDGADFGGTMYDSSRSYEELANPLYADIRGRYDPSLVIDIGANYGFTGLVFARRFPRAKIILVEPDPKLCTYIRRNFQGNGILRFECVQTLCGDVVASQKDFALNPWSSQDNRVTGDDPKWRRILVPCVTLDQLLREYGDDGFTFVKIDTQGYEERVFRGGREFFASHTNWIIKTEFAPHWLRSQGTDPVGFLRELASAYCVAELPVRSRFLGDSLSEVLSKRLDPSQAAGFVQHIQSLNSEGHGWCDLLVAPGR